MKILTFVTMLLIAAAPVTAQSVSALKKELREREAAAKGDVDALVDLADWARQKGLATDRHRILNAVLKLDPDNQRANEMLGLVRYDGKWMTKAKAELLQRKALDAEMKSKGYVEVDGVWVAEDEVADAKKGIFRHEGQRVSKEEKLALTAGKIRHPVTGEFISSIDREKADQGLFPIGGDEWADEARANEYHAAPESPWLFRTYYATVISNMPIAKIKEITQDLDSGFESAKPFLGGVEPSPANRPLIHIANNDEQYRALGEVVGAEGSAYAVFVAESDAHVVGLGNVRPVVMNWRDDWGPYWLRHAAGLSYATSVARDLGADLPLWFARGVAGFAERHYTPGVASHFGKQHLTKGGVKDLKDWFDGFAISGELDTPQIDYNIYQAGLVLGFARDAEDPEATAALTAVQDAAKAGDGNALTQAVRELQDVLAGKEAEVREHLRQITAGG